MGYDTYWSGTLSPDSPVPKGTKLDRSFKFDLADYDSASGEISFDGSTRDSNEGYIGDLLAYLSELPVTYSGFLSATGEDDTDVTEYYIKNSEVDQGLTSTLLSVMVKENDHEFYQEMIRALMDVPEANREFIKKFTEAYAASDMPDVLEEWAKQQILNDKKET